MLRLGSTAIRAVYVGDVKIQKAYKGDGLVYNSKKVSRLPEGYTEVKYIQSGSGQRVNTGFDHNSYSKLEMDVEPLTASNGCFFGASIKVANYNRVAACEKSGTSVIFKLPMTSGSTSFTIAQDVSNRRVHITADYNNGIFAVDDKTLEFSGSWYGVGYPLYLLDGNKGNTGAYSFTALNAKLYSFKAYDSDGVLRVEYVPCVDSTGLPGMYDVINDSFHTYYATPFIAGPAV